MNKIILIKRNKHLPDDFETQNFGLYILGRFLVKDLHTHVDDYVSWIHQPILQVKKNTHKKNGTLLTTIPECVPGSAEQRNYEWLESQDDFWRFNNTTLYRKNNIITIREAWWNKEDPDDEFDLFETTTNELIDIIHQWTDLLKSDPEAVLIEQDDAGKITMKAVPRKTEL